MAPLHHGKGATVSVLLRNFHPKKIIEDMYPIIGRKKRLDGCTELEQQEKHVNHVPKLCVILRHEAFTMPIYAYYRWVKVTKDGPATDFYEGIEDGGGREPYRMKSVTIENVIIRLVQSGCKVDADNQAAEDNVPDNVPLAPVPFSLVCLVLRRH
jgi:hypothetical protein